MTRVLQEQLDSLLDQIGRVIPAGKPRVVCAHMIPVLGLQISGFPTHLPGQRQETQGKHPENNKDVLFSLSWAGISSFLFFGFFN